MDLTPAYTTLISLDSLQVPSFDSTVYQVGPSVPISEQSIGANSITSTIFDFANHSHCDNDVSEYAYGAWGILRVIDQLVAATTPRGTIKDRSFSVVEGENQRVKGGYFVWPEFGVGVDFSASVLTTCQVNF